MPRVVPFHERHNRIATVQVGGDAPYGKDPLP